MDYFKNTANNETTAIETTVHSIGTVAKQKSVVMLLPPWLS